MAVRAPAPKVKIRAPSARTAGCSTRQLCGGGEAEDYLVSTVVVDLADMCEATMEPVFLHVYDLSQQSLDYWRARMPKLACPYYVAVEVLGDEHSFGMDVIHGQAEVTANKPRKNPEHRYRSTLSMGYASLAPSQILRMIEGMDPDWNHNTFNLHSRSSHHFAESLCSQLGVAPLPSWIYDNVSSEAKVFLRVYNLGQTFLTRWHNSLAKSYGAFHTGVEIYGKEWCFGSTQDDSSGVCWIPPGGCDQHDFRESLYMGSTKLSEQEVERVLVFMMTEWPGSSYDMLRRNCHNFSEALCERLGIARPPAWVNELATTLAGGRADVQE